MIEKSIYDATSENRLFSLVEETTEYINSSKLRKNRTVLPKMLASLAAVFILVCALNFTTVLAFFKNLFYIPGFGVTDSEISVMLLKEPVEMNCEIGKFTVEFGTKVMRENGKCEIALFLTTADNIYASGVYIEDMNAKTVIDEKEYILDRGTYYGGGGYNTTLCVKNSDFPDVNEFDLTFEGATAHIVMSEMSEEEKTPYLSQENGGITLAAYKYRNNNRFIGFDVLDKHSADNFMYSSTKLSDLGGSHIYDANGDEIKLAGGGLNKTNNIFESNLTNGLLNLNNNDNVEVKKITADSIIVNYWGDFENPINITLPMPKDGEIIYPDIEVPAGGAVYKIIELRREGDVIYFKDNCVPFYDEMFDRDKAIENREAYITAAWFGNVAIRDYLTDVRIMGFDPDDTSLTVPIVAIEVTYYGDFTINFDERNNNYEK